ncbi:MAG TPA: thioredoxin family protein [Vicinamibacteria bacterium]|nr:thioredoxin family protein [Vicinamibacteria bacterium]
MGSGYLDVAQTPSREQIDSAPGLVLLEFGTDWCPICRALQPYVADLVGRHPQVRHVKVEDGPGRALGRSFRVRLWPNLVFVKDGAVVRQLARPTAAELREAFAAFVAP